MLEKICFLEASSDDHLQQVLALQKENHFSTMGLAQQSESGFVFVEHDLLTLKNMASKMPQTIALMDDKVVAYNLAMDISMADFLPCLIPMFNELNHLQYKNSKIIEKNIFIGGQVCVKHDYRGHGLLKMLYNKTRSLLKGNYDLCITEVSSRNTVSLNAHKKMGFEEIHTYNDDKELWKIIAWPCLN